MGDLAEGTIRAGQPKRNDGMAAGGEPPGIQIGFWNEEELREFVRKSVHPPVNLDT